MHKHLVMCLFICRFIYYVKKKKQSFHFWCILTNKSCMHFNDYVQTKIHTQRSMYRLQNMRCSVFVHMKCNLLKEICNLQKEIWAGPWGSLGIRQSLERNLRSTERNLSRDQVIFGIYTQKFEQGLSQRVYRKKVWAELYQESKERNLQSSERNLSRFVSGGEVCIIP